MRMKRTVGVNQLCMEAQMDGRDSSIIVLERDRTAILSSSFPLLFFSLSFPVEKKERFLLFVWREGEEEESEAKLLFLFLARIFSFSNFFYFFFSQLIVSREHVMYSCVSQQREESGSDHALACLWVPLSTKISSAFMDYLSKDIVSAKIEHSCEEEGC